MSMREKIFAIEDEMRKYGKQGLLEILDIPVRHYFSDGVYAREITIPKGALVTGKIHKYQQLNILSSGELSVWIEDGLIKRVKAPFTTVSPPGTKRIAFAHEESTWTTILATNETDPEKIEAYFIADTEREYLEFCERLQICHS
jgi:uncharacterized RmlC-like cupin family protein